MEPLTYSIEEVAAALGVNAETIYRAVRRGEIPFIAVGRTKRISARIVNRVLDGGSWLQSPG